MKLDEFMDNLRQLYHADKCSYNPEVLIENGLPIEAFIADKDKDKMILSSEDTEGYYFEKNVIRNCSECIYREYIDNLEGDLWCTKLQTIVDGEYIHKKCPMLDNIINYKWER